MALAQSPQQPIPNGLLDAALGYAAQGLPIFPLHHVQPDGTCSCEDAGCVKNRGKHPRTPHGHKDATTDAQQIRAWWRKWPHANIGMPTGADSGRVVIDEDPRNGGDAGPLLLPPTLTVYTWSGGRHFHYARPTLERVPGDNTGKIAAGIDCKADGGYVLLPPSVISGQAYRWEDEGQPVSPLPERILVTLTAKPEPVKRTTATRVSKVSADDRDAYWLDKAMARSSSGTGDATGYWLAQQLLLDPNVKDADGVLLEYAQRATLDTSDPFDVRSVERWLDSAARSNMVARGEPAKGQGQPSGKHGRHEGPKSALPKPSPRSAPGESQVDTPRPSLQIVRPDEAQTGGNEPPSDEALLRGEADDNGNTEAMYRLYGREFLFTPAYGWLRYTGTHWKDVPEPAVAQCAIVALKRRRKAAVEAEAEAIVRATKADKSRVQGVLLLFKSYVLEPSTAVYDADPDLLNVKNGVLNLRTGELTPHDSAQRFTYCVPVEYDPDADVTAWRAFVHDALGRDDALTAYFQTCAGYALTGHTREEKMFYLYGPPRAGKGTVTETLLELLPHPLSTEADFSSFTAQRDNDSQNFDLAELKPARIVIASESNKYQSLNPAKIKTLTGGNHIRCAFKHKDMFTYRPQFKVWLVSNHKVTADADDDALWGRVQVFEFPHSHLGSEDVTLKERMKARANLRGVLAWAVAGARAWYADGHLQPPASVSEATAAHRDEQDYIKHWIDDCCTLEDGAFALSAALMVSYREWCEASGIKRVLNKNELADQITKRFGCTPKRQPGTGVRGYAGIRLGVTAL